MNLLEIREKFRVLSGRYDLVNEDGSDNGANFYINEASRWLDRAIETTKSWATYMTILAIDSWYVRFPSARAIKEVWLSTIDGKWQLEKKRLQDLIAGYFTQPPTEWIPGTPTHFSPTITRYIPDSVTPATLATFASYIGVIPKMPNDYNAVILSCPVEKEALIEISGLFYSRVLDSDNDENTWTVNNPLLLIQTAIRQTYLVSGNKPMLEIIDKGMGTDLEKIDKDLVEQMIAEVDEMEG